MKQMPLARGGHRSVAPHRGGGHARGQDLLRELLHRDLVVVHVRTALLPENARLGHHRRDQQGRHELRHPSRVHDANRSSGDRRCCGRSDCRGRCQGGPGRRRGWWSRCCGGGFLACAAGEAGEHEQSDYPAGADLDELSPRQLLPHCGAPLSSKFPGNTCPISAMEQGPRTVGALESVPLPLCARPNILKPVRLRPGLSLAAHAQRHHSLLLGRPNED